MSETTQAQHCDKCGAPLNGCGPDGLCAVCLLESAFEDQAAPASERPTAAPLLSFRDYELVEEIARGGMGVIYRARQKSLNRTVAIKMILGGHLANAAELQRFRAEAETAAQLQHPNIVAIHEVGEHAGQPFFSMDLVEGRNLAQLVRDEPLPSRKAAVYLKTIAEAVQYAHSRGVLHRDLKPSNILIDEHDQPRITDFGLAKRLDDSQPSTNDPQLTQTGQVLGSPSFIPPEQAAGQKDAIGPASDVYSLGAILYHCLTARPPFVAESLTQTLRMVAEQEPVSPRLLNASVPRDLETICLKCLEKDPSRRYPSAQALAEDLNRFLNNEPIHARPVGVALKVHRWCLRNKPLALAITASLALLLVVEVGSPFAIFRINRERERAETSAKQAKSEAVRSQQVSRILKGMLLAAGPSVARGRDATVLREMLEQTADRVNKEIPDQPEVQGDILRVIGNTYADIGDHVCAATNYQRAVDFYRAAFSGAHTNLALVLACLGRSESFIGDVTRGHEHARLGLQMARECANDEVLIQCLKNYARSFKSWGMSAPEEEPYVREALELSKKLNSDPLQIAARKVDLAGISTNDAETEMLFKDAIALYREHLPASERVLLDALFGLGQHLMGTGQFKEAEQPLREAVVGFHKIHDVNHPFQPIVLRFLVESLLLQGKGDEVKTLVRQQLDQAASKAAYLDLLNRVTLFESIWASGAESVKQLRGDFLVRDLSHLLDQVSSLAELENLWRGVLKRREETLGHGDGETVNARFCLASVLVREGKQTDADVLYREMAEANPDAAGHFYGRGGRWNEAAGAFAQKMEAHPDQLKNYRLLAPILLFRGDVEGYRKVCQQLVDRFKTTIDPVEADEVVRTCLLRPDSSVDMSAVAGLADAAVNLGTQHPYFPWFELSKGLAEYRQGHFTSAESWAQKALGSPGQIERDATALSLLAMAQWQLNQNEAARLALNKASELVNENLPKLDGGDCGNWVDVIGAHISLREARALIQQNDAHAADDSKPAVP